MERKKKSIRHLTDEELTQVSGGTCTYGSGVAVDNNFLSAACTLNHTEAECEAMTGCIWALNYNGSCSCMSYSSYQEAMQKEMEEQAQRSHC